MAFIGQIKQLQIQMNRLKQGVRPHRYYEPSLLRIVPAMRLTPAGAIGLLEGQEIMDVHHALHPQSGYQVMNALSVNFTAHYGLMGQRFGAHLQLGCGGENILVVSDKVWELNELGAGLFILTQDGQEVHLQEVCVAAPCVEFSNYVLGLDMPAPAGIIQETLQFLDHGTRGFYGQYQGAEVVIRPGDHIYSQKPLRKLPAIKSA